MTIHNEFQFENSSIKLMIVNKIILDRHDAADGQFHLWRAKRSKFINIFFYIYILCPSSKRDLKISF